MVFEQKRGKHGHKTALFSSFFVFERCDTIATYEKKEGLWKKEVIIEEVLHAGDQMATGVASVNVMMTVGVNLHVELVA